MSIQTEVVVSTVGLISEFVKLKNSKKVEELESTDWKELESAYYKHLEWRFQYPQKVFTQQIYTGIVISIVVLLLIVSGLAFSFWQLKYAMEIGDVSSLMSDVSVKTAGEISINSSIIGAVVLIISLGFFYLYLKNVFKIQYPTPPHVGLEETDIKEELKAKFFKKVDKHYSSEDIRAVIERIDSLESMNKNAANNG